MQTDMNDKATAQETADEELIDTLIAISVVAKRLARKLSNSKKTDGGNAHGKNE